MGVERDRIFTTRIQNDLELGKFKIDRIFSVEREFFYASKREQKGPTALNSAAMSKTGLTRWRISHVLRVVSVTEVPIGSVC
jgi:hypothetical protein